MHIDRSAFHACYLVLNIHVGLKHICVNYMHIYVSTSLHQFQNDVRDALSSLRGSTSSFFHYLTNHKLLINNLLCIS